MIVLLTDFGQSEYVGVMKGAIFSIDPRANIVDLCHNISPQNLIEASWILKNNCQYFPPSTTFCCVIDPGVGSERKALAVKTDKYYFVAPDNGLLWETLKEQKIIDVRQLPIPTNASSTFHGRDVFAKAAARINTGYFAELGPSTEEIAQLDLTPDGRMGMVVRIDRFGNIITNLQNQNKVVYSVEIGGRKFTMKYSRTYEGAVEGELFLIEGSCNTLEISLKNGNAHKQLPVMAGEKIQIS